MRCVAIAALSLLLAFAPVARGAEGSLVVVVRSAHADSMVAAATARLVAELEAAGFAVRVVAAVGADGRVEVESEDASRAPAFATIAILATDRGAIADVWIADHVTKKTVVRRIEVSDPTRADAAGDLALHSVELLRASLLEVGSRKKELPPDLAEWLSAPDPPADPPTNPPRRKERDALGANIELGVGALISAAGFGVSPGPILGVGYGFDRGLGLRLTFAPALATTVLRAPLGQALLLEQTTRLDIVYAYRRFPIAPTFALGGGLYHVHVDTQRTDGSAESGDAFAGFASAGVGIEARVAPTFAFVCELAALIVAPDSAIPIGDTDAGRLGRPLLLTSLGFVKGF